MAEVNSSNLSPADLHRESHTDADCYAGTKAQLVAASLCKAEWFPKELTLEFCKDGRPKLGNSGKQRRTRVYPVDGSDPAVTLTHRTDAEKREYWWVSIAVTEAERLKREAARHAKQEEEQRRYEEVRRERRAQEAAAAPLVAQLRKRYPSLRISGSVERRDNALFQRLTFIARDVATLQRLGLVTSEMLDEHHRNGDWYTDNSRTGDGFVVGKNGSAEEWMVTLHTSEAIRERKNFPVADARRVLRKIAAASGRSPT